MFKKQMKYLLSVILVSISLLFVSCWNEIDDTNKVYTTNTTTITGKIVTEGGTAPAKGVKLNLDWIIQSELGGTHRSIANTVTDANGIFKFVFYASDTELYFQGGYRINYIGTDTNYVKLVNTNILGYVPLYKRDTVIDKVILLPKRSFIKIKIPDPKIQTYFYVYYRCGDLDFKNSYQNGGSKYYPEIVSEKTVEAAGNQLNYIRISKRIGDEDIFVTDSVYVPIGNTIVYSIK
jgi:hypothetical protein